MSKKKFFSLIYGDRIQAAPKAKIIPAADLSILQESSEVLEHIKEDAEKYRLQVVKECEEIKEHAFKEGYEEGYKQWAELFANFEKELQAQHKEMQQMIIPVALKQQRKLSESRSNSLKMRLSISSLQM